MITPAVKRGKVKDLIKEHHGKKLGAIPANTIASNSGETASFTLVILRKEKRAADAGTAKSGKKEACIEDECRVFATAMGDSWMGGDPNRAAEFYGRR